ncbi:heavy metal-associated isoprenylated plant protein 23 [Salvia miltiorrhiza]|uniref:heavy metal-associated isoprenylated plant protein 23 n=1 Tax=Salvia miltiorrhiza TaxID=226208 RepID=UPI0025ACA117|nr:heavy metal-associated isoprenylated plant protein 23 [Salvia miltiorrhiza]
MGEQLQIVVAGKNVEAQYVEMMVPLYSFGCERKIKNALANLKGIYSVKVDFEQQKVTVWGICDKCDVLSKVKNKRKGARFWELEDQISVQESHFASAPSSPQHSSLSIKKNSAKYLAIIKRQSLNLSLSMLKSRSMNWRALKKVFGRSNSF